MGFVKEFKEFALKGNVVDLAVAVVIGAAFGKIVTSLIDDIITPALLTPALKAAHLSNINELVFPGTAIKYGNFLSAVLDFIVIALILFLIIKAMNSMKKKEVPAASSPVLSTTDKLLTEIRDGLKNNP